MKVLLVTGVYPPRVGGPSAQTQHIARDLIKRGIEAHVITYGEETFSRVIDGIPVTFVDGCSYHSLIKKTMRNVRVYQKIIRVIDDFQPSVIQMQTSSSNLGLLTGIAARSRHIPALRKYSADLLDLRINQDKLVDSSNKNRNLRQQVFAFTLKSIDQLLFSIYDCVWATTPIFKERLIKQYRIPEQKILLLPNLVDLQPFESVALSRNYSDPQGEAISSNADSPDITLLAICRLIPLKGIDLCIQAMSHLLDLPVRFRIVGSGSEDYESYLRSLAEQLNVSSRVEFAGATSPNRIAEEYRTGDIFLLASHYEAFGLVLIEAMASGIPVIATNVGGISNVVEEGVSGLLVPAGDVQSLAMAIRSMIVNKDMRQAMSVAARSRAKQFSLELGLDTLVETYKKLSLT